MADSDFTPEQAKIVDSLLLEAVEGCDYKRIDLCLQKGADIDARNAQGRTPLMMAVWRENASLTQFLIERKASLFLKDKSGKTAYDLIAEVRDGTKRDTITNIMLRALPDHVRKRGATPGEAARIAEGEAQAEERAARERAAANVETGADITVSKPIVLPQRHNPKGFSL